jgi:DHA1 family bicyclomycin/chloramphenicol resistance-like MFS transporter
MPKIMDQWGIHKTIVLGVVALLIGGLMMVVMKSWQTPLGFMLPIFMTSIGFAGVMGAAAGKALSPFGEKAGTAAALLGVIQMSGAGLLVGVVQKLSLKPEESMVLIIALFVPVISILFSRVGKNWYVDATC